MWCLRGSCLVAVTYVAAALGLVMVVLKNFVITHPHQVLLTKGLHSWEDALSA